MMTHFKFVQTICLTGRKKVNVNDIPLLCLNGHNIDRVNEFKLPGGLAYVRGLVLRYV